MENLKTLKVSYMFNYRNGSPFVDRWEEKEIEIRFDFAESKMPSNSYGNAYFKCPMYRVEVPFRYHYLPKNCPLPFNKENIEQFKIECDADQIGSMRHVHCYDSYASAVALFFLDGNPALDCYTKVCDKMAEWALTTYEAHKQWLDQKQADADHLQQMRTNAKSNLESLRERLALI